MSTYRSLADVRWEPLEPDLKQSRPALDVAMLTWNINGNELTPEDAAVWAAALDGRADAYFVSIQELIDIEAKQGRPDRATRERASSEAAAHAEQVLQRALSQHAGEELVPLGAATMLAIFLVGFARPSLATKPQWTLCLPAHYTEEKAAALEAEGQHEGAQTLREKVGQKGGVAMGLRLGGLSLCVMNVHLPAGDKEQSRDERDNAAIWLRGELSRQEMHPAPQLVIMGDVNSRTALDPRLTKDLVRNGEMAEVLERDELVSGAASWAADMSEAEVNWGPSYKFNKQADLDDRKAPSYCDRVLWCKSELVLAREYKLAPEVTSSDHKPVAALLNIAQLDATSS